MRRRPASPVGLERDDLREVIDRHAVGLDANRPQAVERRRSRGHRTTRENIGDLVDDGTFVEYGPLVIAAQRRRRSVEDLIAVDPGRRVGRRDRRGERRAVRLRLVGPGVEGRRRLLRLHRARRDAGDAEPSQEGPPVRGRRAAADPDRVLHRGRGRPPGRHRRHRRERARLSRVPMVRRALRHGAARRGRTRATASPATPRSSGAATS